VKRKENIGKYPFSGLGEDMKEALWCVQPSRYEKVCLTCLLQPENRPTQIRNYSDRIKKVERMRGHFFRRRKTISRHVISWEIVLGLRGFLASSLQKERSRLNLNREKINSCPIAKRAVKNMYVVWYKRPHKIFIGNVY
jgi:hypothetical protein